MPTAHPEKIYVELTTRCNLRCPMCLKFAEGSCITEGDMDLALFERLLPSLGTVRTLVLNGLGEPLLHPELETMVALARTALPADGTIGFQSNGLLLDRGRAERLLAAGLDTVCLSVDDLDGPGGAGADAGHQVRPVERAIASLAAARTRSGRPFRIGIETVLDRDNALHLPELVRWAGARGVDYLIASHLFAYDPRLADESLFSPNSRAAVELFAASQAEARARGVDLADLSAAQRRFDPGPAERLLLGLGDGLRQRARAADLTLHLPGLLALDLDRLAAAERAFDQARELAGELGVALHLPPLYAREGRERSCPFMDERAVFVDQAGRVSPCHFLWHDGPSAVRGERIQVRARVFGRLDEQPLAAIWNQPDSIAFRREAALNDYAPCWSCTAAPCADLVNANLTGGHDCYASRVPCGHCAWGLGWLRCL